MDPVIAYGALGFIVNIVSIGAMISRSSTNIQVRIAVLETKIQRLEKEVKNN
jgi:hypothetical protein